MRGPHRKKETRVSFSCLRVSCFPSRAAVFLFTTGTVLCVAESRKGGGREGGEREVVRDCVQRHNRQAKSSRQREGELEPNRTAVPARKGYNDVRVGYDRTCLLRQQLLAWAVDSSRGLRHASGCRQPQPGHSSSDDLSAKTELLRPS